MRTIQPGRTHQFLDEYPDNEWKIWPEEDIVRSKRKPEDSALSTEELMEMETSLNTGRQPLKIESLEALRGIAFLGIFLQHAGFRVHWAYLSVSVFFVLSGFCLTYKHHNELSFAGGVKNNLVFAVKHISKIYPLHIVTMCMALLIRKGVLRGGIKLLRDVILNVLLLQSWWPATEVNISLNGVAWFLSCAAFLYFMFYPISLFIRRIARRNLLFLSCVLVLFFQLIVSVLGLKIDSSWSFYRWITYDAPFFRLGDFYIGCVLGHFFTRADLSNAGQVKRQPLYTVIEITVAVCCVIIVAWDLGEHTSFISRVFNNYTTIYIPMAVALTYLFAQKRGLLTQCLTNKILMYIGKRSSYYFLIHYIVIRYVKFIRSYVGIEDINIGVDFFIEIIITIILTEVYRMVEPILQKGNKFILNKMNLLR